eukprot:753261-Hanusia_phi.AAC.1
MDKADVELDVLDSGRMLIQKHLAAGRDYDTLMNMFESDLFAVSWRSGGGAGRLGGGDGREELGSSSRGGDDLGDAEVRGRDTTVARGGGGPRDVVPAAGAACGENPAGGNGATELRALKLPTATVVADVATDSWTLCGGCSNSVSFAEISPKNPSDDGILAMSLITVSKPRQRSSAEELKSEEANFEFAVCVPVVGYDEKICRDERQSPEEIVYNRTSSVIAICLPLRVISPSMLPSALRHREPHRWQRLEQRSLSPAALPRPLHGRAGR